MIVQRCATSCKFYSGLLQNGVSNAEIVFVSGRRRLHDKRDVQVILCPDNTWDVQDSTLRVDSAAVAEILWRWSCSVRLTTFFSYFFLCSKTRRKMLGVMMYQSLLCYFILLKWVYS